MSQAARRAVPQPRAGRGQGSKAPWFEITDDLPQHAEFAPTT
jgi:hypothetical protein